MNGYILTANILTTSALVIHAIIGDKELKLLKPDTGDQNDKKLAKWVEMRCGWHWISVDLLLASIGLAVINFTNVFSNEQTLLTIIAVYFFSYAAIWLIILSISHKFRNNYFKLVQWILLSLIGGFVLLGRIG